MNSQTSSNNVKGKMYAKVTSSVNGKTYNLGRVDAKLPIRAFIYRNYTFPRLMKQRKAANGHRAH